MNSRELLTIIDSPIRHAILYMDVTGIIQLWNSGAEEIFRYTKDEIVGQSVRILFRPEDLDRGVPQAEMDEAAQSGYAGSLQWQQRKDGTTFWADGMTYPVLTDTGATLGFVKVLKDATEDKRAEEEISKLALADVLTGLPNRAGFKQRLHEAATISTRNDRPFFVLLMDLDYFKHINDRLGHLGGDELLKQVAERMHSVVRESDVVARLGGDEFGLLITDTDDQAMGGVIAEKILEALKMPFQIDSSQVTVGVSIGISVCPHDGLDVQQLVRKADEALYKAKSEGRNNYQYFTALLNHRAHHRTHELTQMSHVLPRHFSLLYQPVLDSAGNATAVEALLRCSHPYFVSYPIERVVALGAETGRLRDIGMHSVTEACMQVAQWQREGWPDLHLVMNFCRMEIGAIDLAERIVDTMARAAFPLNCFEADLSERQLLGGTHDDIALRDIQRAGVALTIDDFGGDQASLVHLAPLISKVKVDLKHFPGVPDTPDSGALLTAITQLAHALKLPVVIERVQTRDEAEFVRGQCEGMQGFYYAPPMTARNTTRWMASRRPGMVA
jgi:diguanylate cyclase (GGDEF)-like protein/PAS domain S-box-containing protein